jgi:DNA modification methylase
MDRRPDFGTAERDVREKNNLLAGSGIKNLKPNKAWAFDNLDSQQTNYLTHSYHRYPAKFIPQIVRKLIDDYAPNKNQIICDIFGGCGTTLLESKLSGHKSIGFDINPIAKLITQTKITPINPKTLQRQRARFLEYYEKTKPVSFKHHNRIDYWFEQDVVKELNRIYFAIKKIKNPNIRRFFLCAFSHNLKNCSRWLMKSIKPTVDKDKVFPDPQVVFLRHLDSMVKKNQEFYTQLLDAKHLNVPANMYRADSTKKLPVRSESIDLIVTSPPYVTSYEYADLHQLSLLWFGDDPDFKKWYHFSDDFHNFRKNFIGTKSKDAKNGEYNSEVAKQIIERLTKVNRPIAEDVANYFLDMKKVFAEMYRILKIDGKACVIIGNTSLRGVEILNAQVAIEQMQSAGFKRVEFIKREISNKLITPWRDSENGKFTSKKNPSKKRVYAYEYILIMEKPQPLHFKTNVIFMT